MADPPVSPVRSFRDAVGFALELADRYAFVAAAALLDADGVPVDVAVVEGLGSPIEPVVAWAAGADGWRSAPRRTLLISIRPFDPGVVAEDDLRRYRQARWSLGRAGCHLIDWIETDGDLVRSYAYLTCPAEAWAGDPPDHRLVDGGPP